MVQSALMLVKGVFGIDLERVFVVMDWCFLVAVHLRKIRKDVNLVVGGVKELALEAMECGDGIRGWLFAEPAPPVPLSPKGLALLQKEWAAADLMQVLDYPRVYDLMQKHNERPEHENLVFFIQNGDGGIGIEMIGVVQGQQCVRDRDVFRFIKFEIHKSEVIENTSKQHSIRQRTFEGVFDECWFDKDRLLQDTYLGIRENNDIAKEGKEKKKKNQLMCFHERDENAKRAKWTEPKRILQDIWDNVEAVFGRFGGITQGRRAITTVMRTLIIQFSSEQWRNHSDTCSSLLSSLMTWGTSRWDDDEAGMVVQNVRGSIRKQETGLSATTAKGQLLIDNDVHGYDVMRLYDTKLCSLRYLSSQIQVNNERSSCDSDVLSEMKAEAVKEQNTRPIKALTMYPSNTPATLVPRVLPTKKVFYVASNSELNVSRFAEMQKAHNVVKESRLFNRKFILGLSQHLKILNLGAYSRKHRIPPAIMLTKFEESRKTTLEVAFRKHSCYVRDTDGVELLKGSCGSNLYTISIEDMVKSSLICLLSKASKNKSWLWHRHLNHLNFGTINDLAKKDLVRGLPRLKSWCSLLPTNDSENLGKPHPRDDIGIFHWICIRAEKPAPVIPYVPPTITSPSVSISIDLNAPSGSHISSSLDHPSSSVHHVVAGEQYAEVNPFAAADH
ncbi:integrase, catalytic region, zinc finger, CCHC-type containing protein [Tanacetum coccineum]